MDKYVVLGTLGEGSFGRVYKAKQISDGTFVALKVISKRGRSSKELKGFRRECEIQRNLHHPNIIQMIDSFETDNEIVVITEFASNELTALLGKVGYLPEERVQQIVWDLVSALHYLHSNRVLHRDLKPQNILLDVQSRAKLCDFGFARNMSTGTHVLTSIKGTPLYMAPELIDEKPYDYNADLWSLGCIIYELLMGTPPFCTTSILHLIKMIQHEQIQWPTFLSVNCISFLKGLLQKDPSKRLNWEDILAHPFIKGHVHITYKSSNLTSLPPSNSSTEKNKPDLRTEINELSLKQAQISEEGIKNLTSNNTSEELIELEESMKLESNNEKIGDQEVEYATICSTSMNDVEKNDEIKSENAFIFVEDNQPIEMEEWVIFLQHSMQEVINGELALLMHSSQTNVLVTPLRNRSASAKVLSFVVKLLSIPFVTKNIPKESLSQIKKTYIEIKLVPNLVYASKLILRKYCEVNLTDSVSPINSPPLECSTDPSELSCDDVKALEYIYLLICNLVYKDDSFLLQFCDAVVVLGVYKLLKLLLLLSFRQDCHIVSDVLAILTYLLRNFPENINVVEKVLLENADVKPIHFVDLLRNSNPLLRERTCYFILFLTRCSETNIVSTFWSILLKETLEALIYDSIENVRNAAEATVNEIKTKHFYSSVD